MFNKDKYVSEIVYASAKDGQKIPISLLRPKNIDLNR